ncbi:MAG: anti-anti-sigma factor [Gammaproteobacteria bacterium]|nr:anti-anti-sigma factor [Gammaproteobacteria bacterium]
MSSEHQQWLSAASDNQPLTKAQLAQLLADNELQQQLDRYQLVGAVLRREKSPLNADFATDFASLLADEPEYHLNTSHNLAQRVRQFVLQAANGSWLQPVAQGAVAAGVAVLAVIGIQQYQQPQTDLASPLPLLHTSPIAGFATPVSLSQTTVENRFAEQERQAMLEQQQRLQALLNAHRQQVRVMEQSRQANQTTDQSEQQPEQ